MSRTTVNRAFQIGLMLVWPLVPAATGQTTSYDQLVAQAQADLKAGNTAQALTESQKAIATAPSHWEAYIVAGGALQVEQLYGKAIDDFTQALKLAPQAKRAAVQGLLEKCKNAQAAAQSTSAPASAASTQATQPASESTVTQAEVVLWKTIQNSTTPSDFRAYFSQYPNGIFATLARSRLVELQQSSSNGSGPTLEVTLKFVADTINEIGNLEFIASGLNKCDTCTFGYLEAHGSCTESLENNFAVTFSGAVPSAPQCSINYHFLEIRDGPTLSNLDEMISFRSSEKVQLTSLAQYGTQVNAAAGHPEMVETSTLPPITVVELRQKGGRGVYVFYFTDSDTAQRFAKAAGRAVALCGGGEPF